SILLSDLTEALRIYRSGRYGPRIQNVRQQLEIVAYGEDSERAGQAEQLILSLQSAAAASQQYRALQAAESFLGIRSELRAREALDQAALRLYPLIADGKEAANVEEAWKFLERKLATPPRYFRANLPPEILD